MTFINFDRSSADPFDRYQPTSCHMDRFVDLPPSLARAAFLTQIERPQHIEATNGARLEIVDAPVGIGQTSYCPLLTQRATLYARWRRWPVEVELLPWSQRRCQLGLAPRPRHGQLGSDRIFAAGHAILGILATAMLSWAAAAAPAVEGGTSPQRLQAVNSERRRLRVPAAIGTVEPHDLAVYSHARHSTADG